MTAQPPPVFDAHLHIIDPRFGLTANQGYLPPPFSVADYRERTAALGVVGGALVAGSFQGETQDWLAAALAGLGPGFVGVAQLSPATTTARIQQLDAIGVRALRFNLRRGAATDWAAITRLARRAFDAAGWHAEFYLDAAMLADLAPRLATLPRIVIDHLGLAATAAPALLRLVAAGARVKASGLGRFAGDPGPLIAAIVAIDPGALVFGSDLPSTRAPRPFAAADLDGLRATLGDPGLIRRVLFQNALALYRLPATPDIPAPLPGPAGAAADPGNPAAFPPH